MLTLSRKPGESVVINGRIDSIPGLQEIVGGAAETKSHPTPPGRLAGGGLEMRFSNDWFRPHEEEWNKRLVHWGQTHNPVSILEIGSYEGRSSCWFLTHLMEHPNSRLTCVDAWLQSNGARTYSEDMEKVFTTFKHNIQATGKAGRVITRRGNSSAILPTMEAESFDLIYVDGDHSAAGVRADSLEAYRLLKPGGLLLWDDYYWASAVKEGVDQACTQLGITVERFGNNASCVKPGPVAASNPSRKKIVALVPARNEGPRIAFCLRALARYADAIVYLDDCSDDETVAMVESLAGECRVEKILRKTQWHRDEPGDRNALLQAGRAIGGTHFIVLDADEAFTANCSTNQFLRQLILALQPGDSVALNWIQLWRGVDQYRFDKSVWTWNSKAVIFADDGRCSYSSEFIHTPRVPDDLSGRCFSLPGYAHGLLHFQFVNWRNLLVKQAWYRCLEHIREPEKPVQEINRRYAPSKDETGLGLKAAPGEWLAGYPFFDLSIVSELETWREKQILGWFKQFGCDHFRQLDIWDIEWGQPKNHASSVPAGCRVMPHCLPEELRLAQNLIQKAQASMAAGDLSGARAALASALKIIPNDADVTVVHGDILAALADPAGARWEYLRAIALQPSHAVGRVRLRPITASRPAPGGKVPATPAPLLVLDPAPALLPKPLAQPDASPAPLVSALVSAYNCERFMRGCLEDLIGQTLFASGQMEIIVVDSASPQNERVIVQEFQKSFTNIIYLRTEERETIYAAWNRGLQAARGAYLTSANTDDRHRPDALAVMTAYLEEHPSVALVYADQLVSEVPNETFAETQAASRWDWPQYNYAELERRCIVGSQPLWRRSLHDKHGLFLAKLHSAGDYEFWLRIGKAENFYRLPQILGVYYHNPNGQELGAGHSVRETKEIRERYGILARNVADFRTVPVTISREELNQLPFRTVVLPSSAKSGFDPAKPDYNNTPVSPLRPARAYRPTDPAARPVVTIVTPFFNTGDIFEETAQSVLGQTFQQWEWLIINDASNAPEAERVLSRYRQADPRIKVIDQPANSGPGAARNRGVKMASGDYIVLLDSDDLLEPTAVEKWLWYLESHPEHAFVKGYSIGFGAKNYLWSNGFHNREACLKENLVDLTSMIRKTTFATVGGYAEEMRHGFEDWEFWLRCASHGLWGATVPEHLDWYRRRDNHNDRWSNWDSGALQRKARAELQKKYQRLEKSFPSPQPPPIQLGAPVNLDAPARNQLQKTKPRVLLILPWMTMGGADKFNLDLVEQLTERGWEVTCVTTLQGDHSWMPRFNRLTPDIFAMPNFLEIADYPRFLCYLIQSRQIDTVLISNSMAGYQLLMFLRSQFPEVTFLDYCHMEQADWLDGGYPKLSVQSASCLDLSVVSSQHLKRWMVGKGGNPDQIEVCHTNIDAKRWEPDPVIRQRVRSQFDLPEDHPVILYAGRVVEQKQPRVFAETMRLLRAKNSDFTVLVAGDGPDLPWLKEFATQHQLGKNVHFLGGVPNQRIRELMGASDIFFLPSQWEGIALSMFEAMACGLAVVGADVGGQRELVIPGCGHLLPRGEAVSEARAYAAVLAELTADVEKARALGHAARQRVTKEFALDRMGDRMAKLIQQARDRHAAGAKPPVSPETGLAALARLTRIQRSISIALELARKKKWLPALEIFERVRGLAQQGLDKILEGEMDAAIAQVRKLAGIRPAAPLVSVVIACYNYGHLLPEAVESVLGQTFQDFEIIIVNDGSTDNTVEAANLLIQQHCGRHRIRLITQPNSGQPAAARNAGIRAAAGEYVLPLDADDKIAPTFLEKTVAVLRTAPEVGVAYTHIQHFGAIQTVYACGPFEAAVLARDNVLPYCSLYRRRLWEEGGGYRLMGYEDWDFWLTLAERGCKGRLVPEPLFCYRKHGQGMLNQDNQKRDLLMAQMVCNHPELYDASRQESARAVLEQHAAASASKAGDERKDISAVAPDRTPLRITYLISSILGVTGGNQTLLRQAEEMRRRGHRVTIVTCSPKPAWFQFQTPVVQVPAGQPMASSVPPSDVVVATYFINAVELRAVKAPVKVYYAQGDQFVFADAAMADTPQNRQFRELSRASYLLPGIRFVPNSKNLADTVQKLCGRRPDGILPVCTDQTIFRSLERSVAGSRFRLLIVGPDSRGTAAEPLVFKGMQDIHDALQILAAQNPHFTPVRMSGTPPDIFSRLPCEFYIAPGDEMKTVLFGTAHIHIYASHYDSCPRPPQEAMAAGCAVVCTATSGAMEYCREGENCLLVPIQSPGAIATAVGRLIHDHPLREKLVQGGFATARQFPREREWNEWENMLYRFMDEAAKPADATPAATPAKPSRVPARDFPSAIKLPACALAGHLGPARELIKKNKLAAAWERVLAAIQTRPYHPEAFLLLGEIALAAGDGSSATVCAKYARHLAPEWKPPRKFLNRRLGGHAKPHWVSLPDALTQSPSQAAPRLSVSLIVKNEERFLGRCLASVRALARQIVVLDTGSTDRTIEIAKEYGAEVYPFDWTDDFSAARNAALERATGDWVLVLDADEELLPDQLDIMAKEMQAPGAMAYRLPIINQGREQEGCSYVPRLFRNAPGLFFVGRVHEQAFSSIQVRCQEWGLSHLLGKSSLLHHGYSKEIVESRQKIERNLRLLERAIQELPDEPHLLMSLGLELTRTGQREAGLRRYVEAFDLLSQWPPARVVPELRETLLTQLTTRLLADKQFAQVIQLAGKPLVKSGGLTASLHFNFGLAFMESRQPAEAAEHLRQCLKKRNRPALSPVNCEILKAGPRHCLALCLAALKQHAEAHASFQAALAEDPRSRGVRLDLARFQAERGQPLEALQHLNVLRQENDGDLEVWQLGGQIALSQPQFLDFARDWTGEAFKHFPTDSRIVLQRAEALLLSQDVEGAWPLWTRAHSPASARDLAALALIEFLNEGCQHEFSPADEARVSQEFLKWYRQLIQCGARTVICQLHERMDQVRLVLPTFTGVWEAANKQAREAMAA
jgi:glycosyltransferase involved in cell wall biosynthesis/predicted O-methyltransferase YrrM/Tfp pilus assembly protein PilF